MVAGCRDWKHKPLLANWILGNSRIFRFFLVFAVENRINFQLYDFQALTLYLKRQVTFGE